VLAVFFVLPQVATASDLLDYFLAALRRDPALASSVAQVRAAEERARQARASLLPSLSYSASATRSNLDPDALRDRNFSARQSNYQFTMPLFRAQSVLAYIQSDKEIEQIDARADATRSDLATRVVTAWFDALSAQEALRAIQAQKAATEQQLAAARRSFELGAASIADARDAQAKNDVVLAQEAQAQSDVLLKWATLGQVTGKPVRGLEGEKWMHPALEKSLGALDDWLAAARESNPEIAQASRQQDVARLETKKARAGHLPTVDLTSSYAYNISSGSTSSPLPEHDRTFQYGVTVSFPLFSGFGVDAKVGEAVALEDKARGDWGVASDHVELSVQQAYFGLKASLGQIAALTRARESNEVSVKANRRGYEVGMRTSTDVLNAVAQFYETERDLAKARTDGWSNYIKLRILTGKWTENDLLPF